MILNGNWKKLFPSKDGREKRKKRDCNLLKRNKNEITKNKYSVYFYFLISHFCGFVRLLLTSALCNLTGNICKCVFLSSLFCNHRK